MATEAANAAQVEYWNAQAGQTWATFQDKLDRQLEPLGETAMDALAPQPGERIIDIGCGSGQTTLALAARVGDGGRVEGVDISVPMLEVARQRAAAHPNIDFREADAQTHAFPAGMADGVFSRFGVMFFGDPTAAFTNIHKALRPGGRLAFVCWRPLKFNDWMTLPLKAAVEGGGIEPPAPPADPLAPGPFAFADPDRVRGILGDAGFKDVEIKPHDAMIGGNPLDESVELALRVGPLGALLRENPDKRDQVVGAIRDLLAKHVGPDGVRLPGAVWIVTARA